LWNSTKGCKTTLSIVPNTKPCELLGNSNSSLFIGQTHLELTEKLGFDVIDSARDEVFSEVLRKTSNRGADIVFETAAVSQTASQLVSLIRPRGGILIVGLYKESPPVDLLSINFKGGGVTGSRVYSDADFEKAVDLVTSGSTEY
jgi:threonine dehydrogenase-like Zn-dependent dehydrogenase